MEPLPPTLCSKPGFLLTRQWRDTAHGIFIQLWFATDEGPTLVEIPQQRAVCFIARSEITQSNLIAERRAVEMQSPSGEAVDALYFNKQQHLIQWLKSAPHHRRIAMEADIKPVERFLMERFIHSSATIQGKWQKRGSYWLVQQARLSASDFTPSLKLASIDIETGGIQDAPLYSIALQCEEACSVFIVQDADTPYSLDNCTVYPCQSERDVLNAFFQALEQLDPDILIGWNVVDFDLDFLAQCCRRNRTPYRLGRNQETAAILQPQNAGQMRIARIPGRSVLDGIDLLRAAFWQFENFSLEHVAHTLLGKGKLVNSSGADKVAEIQRLYQEEPEMLARYNAQDTLLVSQVFTHAKLLEFSLARAKMTGLPIDKLGGSVAAFDHLYLPRLHRQGRVALSLDQVSEGVNSPGGYVLDSTPGLYKNVLVLDFKSLYPSIIRTFLIDPWGLMEPGEDPIPGFREALFNRNNAILPSVITQLWKDRDNAKQANDQPLSQAIKIIMNSFYGVLGSRGCRFFNPKLASSITLRGHEIITRSRDVIEAQGYSVIYGDTDSLFVLCGESYSQTQAQKSGTELAHYINEWWSNELQQKYNIDSCLEMEFETLYSDFFMPTIRGSESGSKKRYAGTILKDDQTTLIFKGLEAVRTDWTPLAKNFQQELYRRIFANEPYQDFCRAIVAELYRGNLDDQLIYRKRIRRPLESYIKNVPPHIQAARKLDTTGKWIEYVITTAGPEPILTNRYPLDYEHYKQRQITPVADAILQFMGTSLTSLCDDQLPLF